MRNYSKGLRSGSKLLTWSSLNCCVEVLATRQLGDVLCLSFSEETLKATGAIYGLGSSALRFKPIRFASDDQQGRF